MRRPWDAAAFVEERTLFRHNFSSRCWKAPKQDRKLQNRQRNAIMESAVKLMVVVVAVELKLELVLAGFLVNISRRLAHSESRVVRTEAEFIYSDRQH